MDSVSPEEITRFSEHFGAGPTHFCRAPGRVNLIGEHTDYNGLPVFPMALQREIVVIFRPRSDSQVRIVNRDSEFEPQDFHLSTEITPDAPGSWGNYLRAPCQALARKFDDLRGMDALVSSTLPVAAGLSSSSALVIATGRALLHVNRLELPPLELAEEMAQAERYTGTQGGGMDQAISLAAKAGHASRIEFDPLRTFDTPVPPGWRFVVAHTLVRAEKSGPAQAAYNQRRRECQEALHQFWALTEGGELLPSGAEWDAGPPGETGRGSGTANGLTYASLIERVPLEELIGMADGSLENPLNRRFRHVVTEAVRVYEAEKAMQRADLLTFGILMDASHESLRSEYEVSSSELDTLAELAREGGAAGARLTGAGFGGCIVALAGEDQTDAVLWSLEDGYFRRRYPEVPLSDVLFTAEPSAGASIRSL
jgi:galactokinase